MMSQPKSPVKHTQNRLQGQRRVRRTDINKGRGKRSNNTVKKKLKLIKEKLLGEVKGRQKGNDRKTKGLCVQEEREDGRNKRENQKDKERDRK